MKAKYLSLLAVPFLFSACQEEALVNAPTFDKDGQVPVQITLGTPDAMNVTRAYTHTDGNNSATLPESSAKGALNNVDWSKYDLRYILEIYDTDKQEDGDNTIQIGDEKLAKERIYLIAPDGGSVSCAPRLTPNRGYQFVVWADIIKESGLNGEVALSREDDATWKAVADNHYNTNGIYDYTEVIANPSKYVGLKNITINDEWTINDETRDAYFVSQYEVVTTATSLNLTLKRPFGKLRVVTTDIEDLKLGTYPQWTKISYNATRPAAFNAFSKEYSEDEVMAATDVFEASLIYYANESSDASHAYEIDNENKTLFTDYIFGKEGEQTPVQFTLATYEGTDANSRLIHEYAFSTDIPVQRNYLTTLQGNVLTTATDIEIKVDPAFAGNIDFTVEDDGMIKDADGNYIIVNKSGLYYLANTVNSGVYNFVGETVKLGCDIDLEGAEWTPINGFKGTFDGQKAPTMRSQEEDIQCYTISNFKVNVLERGGLFGSVTSATIKNLNVENVNIKSTHYAGAIVAHALCANIENCSVKDITITLNPNVADANGEHNGDKAGGVAGYLCADGGNASLKDCKAENVSITAYRDFGGIVGHTGGSERYIPVISGNSVGGDVKNIILIIDNSNNYKNYTTQSQYNVGAIIGRSDKATGENVETEEGAVFVVYSTEYFEDADNNVHVYTAEALTAAIKDNETATIIMHEGAYAVVVDVKGGKSLTIKAADGEAVVLAGIGHQSNGTPSTVVVEGITIDNSLQLNGWFTGTARNINPCVGAWGGNFTFNNCTFEVEGTSNKETGVMTWWITKENTMLLTFNGCTFNGIDNHASARAMQIYGYANMKVVNCVFNTKKDYSIKYVGQEGNKAEFTGNTVNNTTNFVQLGSSPYPGKDYTVEFTNNTLAEGINHFYIDNEENQTIIVDGLTYVSEGLWKNKAGEYIAQTAEALTAATKNATENITICLGNDIVGNAIAHQNENVNVVIDGKNFKYDGTIDIYGYARHEGIETLAFQNINFEHADGAIDFISCNTTESTKRYAHNVTVDNCTFTGNNSGDVVGMRYRQCYNLTVKNSTATNVHSLLWATGVGNGFTVDNVTVTAKSGGVSFGTTANMEVKNSTFVVSDGYGIRADGNGTYTLNVMNNTITAAMPVVVRNLTGNYKVNLSGTNTLTTDETYQVILTSGTDDLNALAEPTGTYEITGAEAFAVYPKLEAFIGTKSYTKLDDALKAAVNGDIVKVKSGKYYPNNAGGKNITISAMENETVEFMLLNEGEDGCDYGFGGNNTGVGKYIFNNITFNTTENTGNYKGYAYMGATYNNCNFVGAWSLNNYNDYSFNNCTFDFKNGYFWTWGAKSVAFDGCTFNGNSKTILAHGFASTELTINDCAFAATEKGYTGGGDHTACVEIDPAGTNTYTINFTGNNTKTEYYAGWTRIKDGSTGHTIAGVE